MPRPRKAQAARRTVNLGVRLTEAEHGQIETAAQAAGMAPSAYLRELALTGRTPRAAPPIVNHDAFVELVRIGTNVNQMARHANAGRFSVHGLEGLVDRLGAILDRLMTDGAARRG